MSKNKLLYVKKKLGYIVDWIREYKRKMKKDKERDRLAIFSSHSSRMVCTFYITNFIVL